MSDGKKRIFIFVGPNGAGRHTVAEMAGATLDIKKVLSYTTRPPRQSEVDGQDYHFITEKEFKEAQRNGEFVEVMEYEGNLYGVKRADIEKELKEHRAVYLVMSRRGGEVLKQVYGDQAVRIFIYADLDRIVERNRRKGASEENIRQFIAHYDEEMAYKSECEHVFENIDLAHTVFDLTKTLENYLDRNLIDLD